MSGEWIVSPDVLLGSHINRKGIFAKNVLILYAVSIYVYQ